MSPDVETKTPELLAPAGNAECALAAFDAGADAIYCGLGRFNARERAENFTADSFGRIVEFAHSNGRRVYLTLNTLVWESEYTALARELAVAAACEPDAVIVQDIGVAETVRRMFPGLAVHASTQLGIHNSAGVAAAKRLGIRRVILERQVTLDELRLLTKRCDGMELEVFIHGSLCCSLSGRCLFSSHLFEASGNRGECRQPCRRSFNGVFPFSPGDLDGVSVLPELRRLKISSLKIEGRLRAPEYVWKSTRAYRLLLDGPVEPEPERLAEARRLLDSTVSRPAARGFFFAVDYPRLIDPVRSGAFGVPVATVERCERRGVRVRAERRMHLGDRLRFVPPGGGDGESFSLTSLVVDGAERIAVRPGSRCMICGEFSVAPGWRLYKIGENGFDFSRRAAALPPFRRPVPLHIRISAARWQAVTPLLPGWEWRRTIDSPPAKSHALSTARVVETFSSGEPEGWRAGDISVEIAGEFFVPASILKQLRREFWREAAELLKGLPTQETVADPASFFPERRRSAAARENHSPGHVQEYRIRGFIPEGEIESEIRRIAAAVRSGVRRFRVSGLHGVELLAAYSGLEIVAEHPFGAASSYAAAALAALGITAVVPAPEMPDRELELLRRASPLPLVTGDGEVPLLVTRLPLRPGVYRDGRGRSFRGEFDSAEKLFKLFAE